MMLSSRGRSVEPEAGATTTSRPQYVSRRQMRAMSAGPASSSSRRASRYIQEDPSAARAASTLPRNDRGGSQQRAMINQHVNPYQEFPSLRRGFTLEGVPIMEQDEAEAAGMGEGDACAYYFWAIALFFFTLAFLNFIVLMVILHVLEIGPGGMEAMEFLPEFGSVKFLKDLIAPSLTIGSGLISGFAGEPMNIVAENGDIVFQVRGHMDSDLKRPQLRISPHEITLTNVDSFRVVDPSTGRVYFDAFAPEFVMQDPLETLEASEVETNHLVSPINQDLLIKSDSGLELMGAEGIQVEAKSLKMEAGENMEVTATLGSITLDGRVNLDPLALPVGGGGYPGETTQYKVCICGGSGKLFTVPVKSKSKSHKSSGMACLQSFGDTHPCEI